MEKLKFKFELAMKGQRGKDIYLYPFFDPGKR
jgi:hypothetical protein